MVVKRRASCWRRRRQGQALHKLKTHLHANASRRSQIASTTSGSRILPFSRRRASRRPERPVRDVGQGQSEFQATALQLSDRRKERQHVPPCRWVYPTRSDQGVGREASCWNCSRTVAGPPAPRESVRSCAGFRRGVMLIYLLLRFASGDVVGSDRANGQRIVEHRIPDHGQVSARCPPRM